MFSPKMRVKIVNGNNDVIHNKKYPLSANGTQILIKTKGGQGQGDKKIEPTFTSDNIIREKNHWLKFWRPGLYQYCIMKNGALINFKTSKVPELNEAAIDESTEKRILAKLGAEPKPDPLQYISIALIGFLLVLTLVTG